MMIRGVLLDLSGVIYVGDRLIPGALEAIGQLLNSHIPIRFITNTTRSTRKSILKKLSTIGIAIPEHQLFTAPLAARSYIEANGLTPYLLIHPDLKSEFPNSQTDRYDAVLVGDAGQAFTYHSMNSAFRLLLEGAPLLAMGNNLYFKELDGFSLDLGPFVYALERAASTKATVLGKPAAEFFRAAMQDFHCANDQVVMVGDDVDADVIGALDTGLQGILVKTGKYRPGDEQHIQDSRAHLADDITEAVDWIVENR